MGYPDAAWGRAMTVQEVVLKALSGEIHWFRAADILGMSARTLRWWRERYRGFNVRHFHQIARREHGVTVSYSFLKQTLRAAGLVKKHRARGRHRLRREPRACGGELLHLDGSPHAWLALRPDWRGTLITVVDDATTAMFSNRSVVTATVGPGIFDVLHVNDRGNDSRKAGTGQPVVSRDVKCCWGKHRRALEVMKRHAMVRLARFARAFQARVRPRRASEVSTRSPPRQASLLHLQKVLARSSLAIRPGSSSNASRGCRPKTSLCASSRERSPAVGDHQGGPREPGHVLGSREAPHQSARGTSTSGYARWWRIAVSKCASGRSKSWESKATRSPSGDESGLPWFRPGPCVNWVGFAPLASLVQIPKVAPLRLEQNATFRPSGENLAFASAKDDLIRGSEPPSARKRQMSRSVMDLPNTRRSPEVLGRRAPSPESSIRSGGLPPWQNPFVERLIGSVRRKCLDHIVI